MAAAGTLAVHSTSVLHGFIHSPLPPALSVIGLDQIL